MPEEASRPSLIGRMVYGYRVEEMIGHGSQGDIYLLRHPSLPDKFLALKVLREQAGSDSQELRGRFWQDAMAASKVGHEGIVQPLHIDELDDGRPYIVMELAPGRSLDRVLTDTPSLPLRAAVYIAERVARTMALVHDNGIVHRDLKPANLMVERVGLEFTTVKLLDFGVARVSSEIRRYKTAEGTVLGTRFYMAPEVATGSIFDGRADVYSLGIVLFEMLTGTVPFKDLRETATLDRPAPDVSELRSMRLEPVPPSLSKLVAKTLAKRREDRYTMAQLQKELAAVLEVLPPTRPQAWRGATLRAVGVPLIISPQAAERELRGRMTVKIPKLKSILAVPLTAARTRMLEAAQPRTGPASTDEIPGALPGVSFAPLPDLPGPPTEKTEAVTTRRSRAMATAATPPHHRTLYLSLAAVAGMLIGGAALMVARVHGKPVEKKAPPGTTVPPPSATVTAEAVPDEPGIPSPGVPRKRNVGALPATAVAHREAPPPIPSSSTESSEPSWEILPSGTHRALYDVWGSARGVVYAVGERGVVLHSSDGGRHWDHRDWTPRGGASASSLYGVWGGDGDEVWVTGDRGTILHSSDGGASWTTQLSGSETVYYGIWGRGADDLYVVGNPSAILHSTDGGRTWDRQPSHTGNGLRRVWGSGSDDVWAVGWGETVLHSEDSGRSWVPVRSGSLVTLYDVWGSGPEDVYVVGARHPPGSHPRGRDDAILHTRDGGRTWSHESSGNKYPLYAVGGRSRREVYAVGPMGLLLRSTGGGEWERIAGADQRRKLSRIWGGAEGGGIYVVGLDGLILHGD